MDEAPFLLFQDFPRPFWRWLKRKRLGQAGQAITEYLLILLIGLAFTHFVFFDPTYGFKSILDKTMLRLGSFLEENLKTGTKVGGQDGVQSLDPFAGTDRWSN